MFDCGAFTTMTPRRVASATSTLSSPMPARPTTTRSSLAASTSAFTCVALRITSADARRTASRSPPWSSPSCTSTSSPAARIASRPRSASGSDTRTRGAMSPETTSGTQKIGDAANAFTEVVVTQGKRKARISGSAERLAGNDRDLGDFQQHLAQLERRLHALTGELAAEDSFERGKAVERALRLQTRDAGNS